MRAIIPTFLAIAISFSAHAELQSAAEFTQTCVNNLIAQCMTRQPTQSQVDGAEVDPHKCDSSAMMSSYNSSCAPATAQYCGAYQSLAAATGIQSPSGCPSASGPSIPGGGAGGASGNDQAQLASAKADLQRCQSMQSAAQACCGNPASCGGTSNTGDLQKLEDVAQNAQQDGDTDSLNQICSQAQTAADASGDLSSSYASVCAAKHLSCSDACGQLWTKWNITASGCQGSTCDQLSQVVAQMNSQQNSCTQMSATEQIMQDQAMQQAINSRISAICIARGGTGAKAPAPNPPDPSTPPSTSPPSDQVAQSPPSTSPDPQQQTNQPNQQQPNLQQNPQINQPPQVAAMQPPMGSSECGAAGNINACVNCAAHPEYPSCGGGTASASPNQVAQNENGGPASAASAGIPNAAGMNVGTSGGHQDFSSTDSPGMQAANANAPGMNPYGNATGMNGAGGIGVFPPLDHNNLSGSLLSRAQFIAAKQGLNTEIFSGERGGGGYSAPTNQAGSGFEGSGRGLAGSRVAQAAQKNYVGLDLKRYLPGQFGSGRGLAGLGLAQSEIGPMSTDMFQRVSLRFKLICFDHGLIDCN